MMYAVLQVRLPDGSEDAWPITAPGIILGRNAGNQVVLEDESVSRQHAEILFGPSGPQVRDLGSANGTWLNDQPLAPRVLWPLRSADVLRIGSFLFRLAPPAETWSGPAPERVRLGAAQPTLLVQWEGGRVTAPLTKDVITMGRAPDNDVVITAPIVSGHHARLERQPDGYRIVDLNSRNGLLANGQRVQQKTLRDGDAVSVLGQVWVQYRRRAGFAPADQPLAPEQSVIRQLDPTRQNQITIGRSADNDIHLDDPRVSRRHALVERLGSRFRLRDLGSDNGTFVNGEPAKGTVWLKPGDQIHIAKFRLVFAQDGLQQLDLPYGLRLDALHLQKWVSKDKNILQDISLSILPREFVALVGVSGAGKSTLLDALNGFRPAGHGRVLVNGQDLYQNYDAFRSELGYVPQDDIMHRELTVQQALDYAAKLRMPGDTTEAERQRRVAEVMRELGLAERKDLPIIKLSGGQRKRVSIGIELLTKPGLFFLDEATSGLDPGTEAELMRLLRQLADDGRTIVLITHATKNVMMCDKVIFLAKGGHLAFFGPPEEALAFFERYRSGEERLLKPDIDFDDIYTILENPALGAPEQWAERYRQSDAFRQYVAGRLAERKQPTPPAGQVAVARSPRRVPPPRRPVSSLRQFAVLTSRQVRVMLGDRKSLAVLLLQAPLIGMTTLVSLNQPTFDSILGKVSAALTSLFIMVIVVMLFGTVNTAREITKEAPVYRRERMVNLRIVPYIGSKVAIVILLCSYQVSVYLLFTIFTTDYPHVSASAWAQFVGILLLASISGGLLGLLISALTTSTDQATALIPVILIPQFIFAGVLMPELASSPVSKVATSKWAVEAMATIMLADQAGREGELQRAEAEAVAQLPSGTPTDQIETARVEARQQADQEFTEALFEQFGDIFHVAIGPRFVAMGVIIAVLIGLILLLQKRKDRA
jgi:ABC-type multidrug transport system ATPase subunit